MHNRKILYWVECTTMTLGALGLALVLVGGATCLTGLSGKAANKLAVALKPHQVLMQGMVNYGSGIAYVGLFAIGAGMVIAKTIGETLIDIEFGAEIDANLQKLEERPSSCHDCIYFSDNGIRLSCAVRHHVKIT